MTGWRRRLPSCSAFLLALIVAATAVSATERVADTVVGYYGHPFSDRMGILGEYSIPDLAERLRRTADRFDEVNGELGVRPAFHLIFGTVYPSGEIGYLPHARVMEYIEYAAEHGFLVILDHQIGRNDVGYAIDRMLPYLHYPNVHLAIDPEWRTDTPGAVLGSVTGMEINQSQETIGAYLQEHGLPGPRILIVHQFNWRMVSSTEVIRTDYPGVRLIHNASGWGPPQDKMKTWDWLVTVETMPDKGFKVFYPKPWKQSGFDNPGLTPQEVMNLDPMPAYVNFQ